MRKLPARTWGAPAIAMGTAAVAFAGTGAALASSSGPVSAPATARATTPHNVDFRGVWASSSGGRRALSDGCIVCEHTGVTRS